MDYAACNVVYVDRTAQEDRLVKRDEATLIGSADKSSIPSDNYAPDSRAPGTVEENLQVLLETFSEGRSSCTFLAPL